MLKLVATLLTGIWNFIVHWFGHCFGYGNYKTIHQASSGDDKSEFVTNKSNTVYTDEDVYPCAGRGLCIIIANFIGDCAGTAHLRGYIPDKKKLVELFGTKLDFDVIVETKNRKLENLCLQEFQEALKELQNVVIERCSKACEEKRYDRFVMFVLGHGGENGFCTCHPRMFGKQKEHDEDGNLVFISVDEIINAFTHDNVPQLKGIPKAFFFQACRGSSYVMAAADKGDASEIEDDNVDIELKKPTLKRENIFVAYATLDHKYCFVDKDKGSWFIQTVAKEMEIRCGTDDLIGIMTRVIREISGKSEKKFFHCNDPKYEIRVLHDEVYRPLLICGKLDKADNPEFCKFQPLHITNMSYASFAPSRSTNQELINYEFKGYIKYLKVKGASTLLIESWISAEELKTFRDSKHFEIHGEMRLKENPQRFVKGEVEIIGHTFNIDHYIRPKDQSEMNNIVIQGYLPDSKVWLTEEDMENKKAHVYVENHLYSIGKLEKCFGSRILGMYAEIYQLPVISSTLTKKMYLTAPRQSAFEVCGYSIIA